MVNLSLGPWAWPLCLALLLTAGQAWPAQGRARALLALALAFGSAWAGSAGLALGLAVASVASAWPRRPYALALGLPVLLLALLRARLAWLPVLPGDLAFWAGLLALVVVCLAGQGVVAAQTPEGLSLALGVGQAGWACFGLVTGSPAVPVAWMGLLGLLWQQALLRQPLESALRNPAPPVWSTALLFLGLGGCLGFSGFSAYFQLFIPLMAQGDGVADMHAHLFSGAGLLAAVAMLAVLVQTSAFGYFYWLRVLPQAPMEAPAAPVSWATKFWPWLALGLSLAWGLQAQAMGQLALAALQSIGVSLPPSS
jgi:hypothetical protein